MRLAFTLVAVLAVAALTCGLVVYVQGKKPVKRGAQYVTLGSSFASGPGLPFQSVGSPVLCARSGQNYAHLLAQKRGLTLVDMSCAGATTHDVLIGGQYFQGAQLAAIDASTELVTITIGGNDVQYLSNLVAKSCPSHHSIVSTILRACVVTPESVVSQHLGELENRLRTIAAEIAVRSPKARLVFVGYLDVLPAEGNCKRLGLNDEDVVAMRAVAQRIKDATYSAAVASGAAYVDPNEPGADHSACSTHPWVNSRFPKGFLAAPFHPTIEGMIAVARAIDESFDPGKLK